MKHAFLGMDKHGYVSRTVGQIFRARVSNIFMAKGHTNYCGLVCGSLTEK